MSFSSNIVENRHLSKVNSDFKAGSAIQPGQGLVLNSAGRLVPGAGTRTVAGTTVSVGVGDTYAAGTRVLTVGLSAVDIAYLRLSATNPALAVGDKLSFDSSGYIIEDADADLEDVIGYAAEAKSASVGGLIKTFIMR